MLRKNIYRMYLVFFVFCIGGFTLLGHNFNISSKSRDEYYELTLPLNSGMNDFEEVWNRTWGVAGDTDFGQDLVVDSSNDVYVTGMTGEMTPTKLKLIKFSSEGDHYWNITWGINGERGTGIALDSHDDVFIVGYTQAYGAGSNDVLLMKYNSSGDMQWYKTWGTSANDGASDIAIDAFDNIYVSGYTSSYGAGQNDNLLLKYNSSGDLQWYRTWGTGIHEWGDGVAINTLTGDVCVVGTTSGWDAYVVCYNSSGYEQWNQIFNGGLSDGGRGIALDSLGNVYATGYTEKAGLNDEVFLWKLNSSGHEEWNRTWGEIGGDRGQNLVIDSNDEIFITGFTYLSDYEAVILKYDAQGNRIFNFTWGATNLDYGFGIYLDQYEDLYISGVSYLTDPSFGDSYLVKFTNDDISPEITIHSPELDDTFEIFAPIYNISVIEENIDSIWYTLDMGATNYTITETIGYINQIAWENLPDGHVLIRFYVKDMKYHISFDEVLVVKDTIKYLHLDSIGLTCSTEEFNVTLFVSNNSREGIDFAIFQIWWNGSDISTNIVNLGNGLYFITLDPITVPPGADPILLNMTIQADGYEEKYIELNIAIDPDTLEKETEPLGFPWIWFIVLSAAFVGIVLVVFSVYWIKKKRMKQKI